MQNEIEKHILLNGVIKCPTVCLSKTTANTSAHDRRTLRLHHEKQIRLANIRHKKEILKVFFFFVGLVIGQLN